MTVTDEEAAAAASTDKVVLSDGTEVTVLRATAAKIPTWEDMDERRREKSGGGLFEKIRNVWGSSAGAGSDFFDTYRKDRAEEMQRLRLMELRAKEKEEHDEFQAKRAAAAAINAQRQKRKSRRIEKRNAKKNRSEQPPVIDSTQPSNPSPPLIPTPKSPPMKLHDNLRVIEADEVQF